MNTVFELSGELVPAETAYNLMPPSQLQTPSQLQISGRKNLIAVERRLVNSTDRLQLECLQQQINDVQCTLDADLFQNDVSELRT